MQDIVFDIVRNLQDRDDIHFYGDIYTNGDTDEPILVLTSCTESDVLAMMFREILLKTDDDFRDAYPNEALDYICDGDCNCTFDDEGAECTECCKWYYYDNRGGCSYSRFFNGDGFRMCENCVKEDPTEYIEHLINNPKSANTILSDSELIKLGFEKVAGRFENGFYEGQNDDPVKIMETKIKNEGGKYLFSIDKDYNPFQTVWTMWERMEEE